MIRLAHDIPIPSSAQGGVVAIGNFDGVHIGHQAMLETARRRARDLSVPFVVLTFDPHPRRYFRPDAPGFLLTPGEIKYDRLATSKVDTVLSLPFDETLAHQTPEQFIHDILINKLKAQHVFTGRDFHFGHNRAGTPNTIQSCGIDTTQIDLMTDHTGNPYSSTRIRAALQEGHLDDANRLLGWPWEMRGTVIHGDQRGRTLGFPTANILPMSDALIPAHGIYAGTCATRSGTTWYKAAISLGHRPMFAVEGALLEVHLLDFQGDLYGQELRVRFARKLRDEMRFDSLDALITQMAMDCDQTRAILQNRSLTQ